MTTKKYFSRIIGSGTDDDVYRPAVANYPVNWSAEIPTDPETGKPLSVWAKVIVDAEDDVHAALSADENMSLDE